MKAELMTEEKRSWSYPYKCSLCDSTMIDVLHLEIGTLFMCNNMECNFLTSNFEVKEKPFHTDEKKSEEYCAVARKSMEYSDLVENQKVLDVQSRDGILLGWYNPNTFTVGWETEPSLIKDSIKSKRVDYVVSDDFYAEKFHKYVALGDAKFKIITLIDILQNATGVKGYLLQSKELLRGDGLLVLQFPYLPKILEEIQRDGADKFIRCRNYFFVFTLRNLLQKMEMTVQGVESAKSYVRLYVTHRSNDKFSNNNYQEKLRLYLGIKNAIVLTEMAGRFHDPLTYQRFKDLIEPDKPKMRGEQNG